MLTGKADDEAAADVFEEAMRLAPLDYDSGLAYGYSLIQLGRLEEANKEINALRMRFGERTRLRMLDRVLQNKVQELRQETQR